MIATGLVWACIVALPLVETLLFLKWIPGASLRHFVPGGPIDWWNDEVEYWQQAASFATAGFGAGQYGWDEGAAAFHASPYGTHGPAQPVFVGLVARAVGFSWATPLFLGMATLIAGLALTGVWWTWKGVGLQRALLAAAALATAWPTLLMLPGGMTEPLHAGFAVALAGGFTLLVRGHTDRWRVLVPLGAVLLLASLLRVTWSPLFVPYLLFAWRARTPGVAWWKPVAAGIGAAAALFALTAYMSAPYPLGFLAQLRGAESVGIQLDLLWDHLVANVSSVFGGKDPYGLTALPLERFQYLQLAGITTVAAGMGLWGLRSRTWGGGAWTVHIWNLGSVLLVTLVLYDTLALRGMRVLSGHLLMTLVLLAGTGRVVGRLVLGLVVASALLSFGTFRATFIDVHRDHYPTATPEIAEASAAFSRAGVRYTPGATRWCNTLLWIAPFDRPALAVPPGVAINFSLGPGQLTSPPRSRWILVGDAAAADPAVRGWEIRDVGAIGGLGTIYRNSAARC